MAKVIPMRGFGSGLAGVPEQSLARPPSFAASRQATGAVAKVDLRDKPKLWLLSGPGGAGKTALARWLVWRMQQAGREAALAALDPANRSLAEWFGDVMVPPARDGVAVSRWLTELFEGLMEDPFSAIFDFGAGSTALERLAQAAPGLHTSLAAAGIGVVATYVITPRADDLVIPQMIEATGFRPDATLIVLNEGRSDPTVMPEQAFSEICRHSAFRALTDRGAQVVWMPGLESDVMMEIEAKRLSFGQGRDGLVPDGAQFPPIGGLRRAMVGRWLARMEEVFRPVGTWLP